MAAWRTSVVLILLAAAGLAQSISPSSLTTGLSWAGGTGNTYTPQTFTTTGLSCAPCSWSLTSGTAVENGTTATDLGVISGCSSNNVACNYTAPTNYDTNTPTILVKATDGTTTVTATITLVFPNNLESAYLERGRLAVFNSPPYAAVATNPCGSGATNVTCYEPWSVWFAPVQVSYPAGTGINFEPSEDIEGWIANLYPEWSTQQSGLVWTRDGKWFEIGYHGGIQVTLPDVYDSAEYFLQGADGKGYQQLPQAGVPNQLGDWLPLERQPEWIAQGEYVDSTHNYLDIINLSSIDSGTGTYQTVRAYTAPSGAGPLMVDWANDSNVSGYWSTYLLATNPNPGNDGTPSCSDVTTCTNIPQVYPLQMSGCYSSLAASCATLAASSFGINRGITFGWNGSNGDQHCDASVFPVGQRGTECEFATHASGTRKGTGLAFVNYGSSGAPGEPIVFTLNTLSGGAPALLYPNTTYPQTGPNLPYFGHGDYSFNGNWFQGSGYAACTPNSSHVCTAWTGSESEYVWDFRAGGVLSWSGSPVEYSANPNGQGHSSWDSFDLTSTFADGWSGTSSGTATNSAWDVYRDYIPPSQGQAIVMLDGGQRSSAGTGGSFVMYWPPVPSPDSTKFMENLPDSYVSSGPTQDYVNAGGEYRTPTPPDLLKMTNSGGSADPSFSFVPDWRNHEVVTYNVYRCTATTTGCSFLESIPAVYDNLYDAGVYSFTDSTFTSGGPYWYGVASVEQDGAEGAMLSNTVEVSLSGGIYTGTFANGAGTSGFDTGTPSSAPWVSAALSHIPALSPVYGLAQTTGGTIADGTYWVFAEAIQCTDLPACTTFTTQPGPTGTVSSVVVSGGGGTAAINFVTTNRGTDMYGQNGYRIWVAEGVTEPALSTFTLQTCSGESADYLLPRNGAATNNHYGNSVTCTLDAFSTATSFGTPADTTVEGFNLTFTANAATDRVRMWDIYSEAGSAPPLSGEESAALPYLIESLPASACTAGASCSWIDMGQDVNTVNAGTHIYYGIVPVGQDGNRGIATCYDATAGAGVACN